MIRAHHLHRLAASAGAAGALAVAAATAMAQTAPIVRITRSVGAVDSAGHSYRLGAMPAAAPGFVAVTPTAVCCPGTVPARCVTERQVQLGASRQQVVDRYGPPGNGSTGTLLRYVGIQFELDAASGRTTRICAVR